jgi:hypothetical protein
VSGEGECDRADALSNIVIHRNTFMQRLFAKHLLPSTLIAFTCLAGAAATAGEMPSFEVSSFPATQHQLAVMGSAGVQEQSATPVLTRADMPASPHQLAVLSPHRRSAAAASTTTVAASRN